MINAKDFIRIKIPRAVLYLTKEEFIEAIHRGKMIERANQSRQRREEKYREVFKDASIQKEHVND